MIQIGQAYISKHSNDPNEKPDVVTEVNKDYVRYKCSNCGGVHRRTISEFLDIRKLRNEDEEML
jgi:uncharacterized Zn finger protein